jgi:hypothetical protein
MTVCAIRPCGGIAERSMAVVLKTDPANLQKPGIPA